MARLTLKDLPPSLRAQVMKQYDLGQMNGAAKPQKRATKKSASPYADQLQAALVQRFENHHLCKEYARAVPGRKFRIDFAYPLEKVAIEFDGYRHHALSRNGFKQGLQRQNQLVANGWYVLRYSLTDVRDRLPHILAEVEQALRQKAFQKQKN